MKKYLDRRGFLTAMGAAAMASGFPARVLAQGAGAPLRLGIQDTSWGAVGMIAEAQKTFAKAGANVKVYRFSSGKATRDAMIAGRVDIGVLGATPFIVGAAKGQIVSIGIAMYAGKTNAVVAAVGSGIKTVADLKGKRVASQLGSATDYVFQNKILPKYGLAKGDVQIVNVTFQNQIAALVAKSVDAFAGVEPFPSVAEVDGLGTVLVDYAKFDLQPVFLGVNRPVLEGKHDAVVAFLRGWLLAVNIMNKEPDRAVRIVWDQFKSQGYEIKEAVIKRMMTKLDVKPEYVPQLREYLTEQAQNLVDRKKIAAVPDWSKELDTEALAQAMKA